ncbi:MAG TPA: TylF/MycF/NovP-related O-methyltransferase [Acidimicrobiales bacterium]|nr:TylF/MycF/NovP-related O-methyltransferase [Acidimicrobiales bacterium]
MSRLLRRRAGDRAPSSGSGSGGAGATPPVSTTFTPLEVEVLERVRPYTMTSPERLIALMDATSYVVRRGIPGAVVECGVWRGGSVLAAIEVLLRLGVTDRDVYLYDTFEGMTRPTQADTSTFERERSALTSWTRSESEGRRAWDWAFHPDVFSLDNVKELLYGTGYPRERIHFVVGPVEETIPGRLPDRTALLRLDTDWYESTRHELVHLYPGLSEGGVLIIDDYGHWEGARRAVDEYFASEARPLLLARIDYTGRMGVKGPA